MNPFIFILIALRKLEPLECTGNCISQVLDASSLRATFGHYVEASVLVVDRTRSFTLQANNILN